MIDFEIVPNARGATGPERRAAVARPGFGTVFTDHMVTVRWTAGRGWHDGRVEPFAPFTLPPSTSVFHYGQAVFEGMKAYRQASGSVALSGRTRTQSASSAPRSGSRCPSSRSTTSSAPSSCW